MIILSYKVNVLLANTLIYANLKILTKLNLIFIILCYLVSYLINSAKFLKLRFTFMSNIIYVRTFCKILFNSLLSWFDIILNVKQICGCIEYKKLIKANPKFTYTADNYYYDIMLLFKHL